MPGIKIENLGDEDTQITKVIVPYRGKDALSHDVYVTVRVGGINIAHTAILNTDGVKAVKQALAIAEAIQERGYWFENDD